MFRCLSESWPWLLALLDLVLAIVATIHAVLWKRDNRAVIAWVGLVWLAPILGALGYFLLGVNRIQRKAIALKLPRGGRHQDVVQPTADDLVRRDVIAHQHPNLVGLDRLGERLTGHPALSGNKVHLLVNGDEAYPAMIKAIDEAQHSLSLLTYIFDSDRAGDAFLEALVRAEAREVEVRVLIDHIGSRYSRPSMATRLQQSGIRVATFLPTRIPRSVRYANLRNHKKIMVADGHVAFTGGTNIREGHWLSLPPDSPVICAHFRLEGPIAGQLQEAFAMDWDFSTGESLGGERWFPQPVSAGSVWARGIPDGPDEDFEKLSYTMLGGVAAATHHIRIVTPYFLPSASLIHGLNIAAMRGVQVDIVLPSQSNIPLIHWASRAQFWQMLERGCRIHLTPPPFDHTKLMVVDGAWSLIGSSNWDPRSLRLNFEYNVECYDSTLAHQLDTLIDGKIASAHAVSLKEINGWRFPVRLRDGLARLLSPYL